MMVWDEIESALISRLARYQAFTSEAAHGRLYQAILNGANRIRRVGEWDWKNQTTTLATTDGNLGPYTLPAAFYRFAIERKIYRYGFTDTAGVVLAPIRRTDTNFYDVILNVEDGGLYFRENPGTGTVTINFLGELSSTPNEANCQAVIESMPGNLYDILANFVEADFLNESPDTRNEGLTLLRIGDIDLKKEWSEYNRGRHRQRQRSPRGQDGSPILDGLGRNPSLRKGARNLYHRGRYG